eukprot:TRINITY_DN3902_c1_g1_i1.p1 TRINITY_DN3902_c1_g1~~TRINITY_DN3902_c1_g1_i1.p1  ORF type:complete len:644 (-),score=79.59 TRINITY_DN3902_c1_g1_i1:51-1982(-)
METEDIEISVDTEGSINSDNSETSCLLQKDAGKWKKRDIVLYENRFLFVMKDTEYVPHHAFFLDSCVVIKEGDEDIFRIFDYIQAAEFVVKFNYQPPIFSSNIPRLLSLLRSRSVKKVGTEPQEEESGSPKIKKDVGKIIKKPDPIPNPVRKLRSLESVSDEQREKWRNENEFGEGSSMQGNSRANPLRRAGSENNVKSSNSSFKLNMDIFGEKETTPEEKPAPELENLQRVKSNVGKLNTILQEQVKTVHQPVLHPPSIHDLLAMLPVLSYFLKYTGTYPWQSLPMVILQWSMRVLSVVIIALNIYSSAKSTNPFFLTAPTLWNTPTYCFYVLMVFIKIFTPRYVNSHHFKYLLSEALASNSTEFIKRLKRNISTPIFTATFLTVCVIPPLLFFQPQGILFTVTVFYIVVNIIPLMVMPFVLLTLTCGIHKHYFNRISLLAQSLSASHKQISLETLHNHVIHEWISVNHTARKWSFVFCLVVLFFISSIILYSIRLSHLTVNEIYQFLFLLLFITTTLFYIIFFASPICDLNVETQKLINKLTLFFNTNSWNPIFSISSSPTPLLGRSVLSENQTYSNFSVEDDSHRAERMEFCYQLEKINLSFVLFDVPITFDIILRLTYVLGGIIVFILSQSSVNKNGFF